MSTCDSHPEKAPRKRWHPLAILASILFVAIFLLANIPGNPSIGPEILSDGKYGPHFGCYLQSFVHGWPFTFLDQEGYFSPNDELSVWRIGKVLEFRPLSLALNVGCLLLGVVAIGWCVNRHITKHGFRFRLIHLLGATVVVALIATWVTERSRIHRAQVRLVDSAGYIDFKYAEWQPFGPYWLRLLTGDRLWEWGDLLAAADLNHSDQIENLPGKSSIQVLTISQIRCEAMPSLEGFDRLLAIDLNWVSYDYENVPVNTEPETWPCMRVIAQCETIQGLNLYDAGINDRAVEELARMPNLVNLVLSVNTDITDRGLEHLASIKSLKRVELGGTGVTESGVRKLQAALPDCEIGWE